jgi:hypothetical protein
MPHTGETAKRVSSVARRQSFYVMHQRISGLLNMGISDDVERRRREHSTAGGDHRLLWIVGDADQNFERAIFDRLGKYRIRSEEERRDYELFRPAPEVWRFLSSALARDEFGFRRVGKPYAERDTCKRYLQSGELHGCDACAFALEEDARLRQMVPATARGGWVLLELCSGRVSKQMLLALDGGIASHGVSVGKLNHWPLHVITYRGATFRFPVFDEICRRQGVRPPQGAIKIGLPFRSAKIPSGRKGVPLRKREQERATRVSPPEQRNLFDGAS